MNKKRALVILCILALAVGSLAWGQQGQSPQTSQEEQPEVPEHIAYKHLFHHVAAFKKEAEKAELEGRDSEPFKTHFKRKAELSNEQARVLDEIAMECDKEIKKLDARARKILDAYKAQYPGGRVPHGEVPQPPPAELRTLTEERDAIVISYRDRLRAALGESEFSRFNNFVKRRVVPNIRQQSARQTPPVSQQDAQ